MARDSLSVLVGTGALYVADVGTAFPSPPEGTLDEATPPTGFTGLGYSEDGWSFEVDRTFEDVNVAEEFDPVAVLKTAQSIRLVGALAQSTLTSIQLALGGGTISAGSPAGHDSYAPPASADAADEKALVLVTPAKPVAAVAKRRFIEIPRAIATGAVAIQVQKAPQKQLIAIEFRLLIPSSGDIFTIRDQVT